MQYTLMEAFFSPTASRTELSRLSTFGNLPQSVADRALQLAEAANADIIITSEDGQTWII